MNNIDIKRISIHECCHAIVARFFCPRLTIDELVLNTDMVRNNQDLGALNIKGPLLNDEQDYTALAITLFAGVVGDNMHLVGIQTIKEKREEIIADNTQLSWLLGGGDFPLFLNNANIFSLLYQIDGSKLKEFCLRFLIDFLGNTEVWSMVEKLSSELLRKDELKLNERELESIFRQIGLDDWFDKNRGQYQKQLDEVIKFCQKRDSLFMDPENHVDIFQ